MGIEIDEKNLKKGLLGLVMALVEIIQEALEGQAINRMESGSLTKEEVERLGQALIELKETVEAIKKEHELEKTVRSVREGLDDIANNVVNTFVNPEKWREEHATSPGA